MNSLEQEYYEHSEFWREGVLEDEANKERFRITSELIPNHISNFIDIGCGNGAFVHFLKAQGRSFDINAADRSKEALSHVSVPKSLISIDQLPFNDESFDCVSCLQVIEHLPLGIYRKALSELARISRHYLLVSVPYNERLEDSYTKCPSCQSIFNYELHLRNYSDETFQSLFIDFGYKNIATVKSGLSENYKYHRAYTKLFYPEQVYKWNSPICPICGYTEEKFKAKIPEQHVNKPKQSEKRAISYIASIPKLFWPKEKKYYWVIGLFEKSE